MTKERRPHRSDHYQHLILEIPISYEYMTSFVDNKIVHSERYLELQDQLKVAYWELLDRIATPRQIEVSKLLADGYTQKEIAKILNINQSSIVKCISGNTEYKKGHDGPTKKYGGLKKKAQKYAAQDPKIQSILKQLQELDA